MNKVQNENKNYAIKEKAGHISKGENANNLKLQKTGWEKWMENIESRIFDNYKTKEDYK